MVEFKNGIGEQFKTNEGYIIEIVEYNNNTDIWIEFQDEYKTRVHTNYQACKLGRVKNPYHPNKYGGYLGIGKYEASFNGKMTDTYNDWFSILVRCFNKEHLETHPTYEDIIINKECLCFQNFAEWWHNNYYEVEGERMHIDKDILIKGNKEYRFDRMIFVPERINILFTKRQNNRGNYPIGVSFHKAQGKYIARCSTLESRKHLGSYNTPEEAFLAYKEFKEAYIKQVADEYKGRIPDKLYDAMYRYEVEIDD